MTSARGHVVSVSRNETYSFTKPVRDEITLVAGIGVKGDGHAGVHVKHRWRMRTDPAQPNLRQVHLIGRELFAEVGEKGYAVVPGDLGENVTTGGIDLLGLPVGTILRFGPPHPDGVIGGPEGTVVRQGIAGPRALPGTGPVGSAAAIADLVAAAEAATLDTPTAAAVRAVIAAAARDAAAGQDQDAMADRHAVADRHAAAVLDVANASQTAARDAAAGPETATAWDVGGDLRPAVVLAGLRNPCAQINRFQPGLLKEVIGRDGAGRAVRKGGVMAVVLRGGQVRPGDLVDIELPPLPHAPLDLV